MNDLHQRLERTPVVPLVQASDADTANRITGALVKGGLTVIEVVLRTPAALECLERVAADNPGALVGAGTVLDQQQCRAAIAAGARFIVSPGLDEGVVATAHEAGVAVLPGIATATEAQRARNLGVSTVKFFPASRAGGPGMLKALASVFSDLRFMPTGGISPDNLADYLAVPAVLACGGSWLTPASAVAEGRFDEITGLATEALNLAAAARG
ncbi:MAG: bifunctional 4-hydroxy-2-oxoglutarate aldolase/2-dehydro-3-deoxy-phosphogluconate aldolase [Xanthomonadales bacterium]|nr:bifunctional 4-hydroxy-2-oxoglutarate aldolase/2-dehydro-3-deoxy-phosphogluconate aldolase [Xanthomonadales bacterium]